MTLNYIKKIKGAADKNGSKNVRVNVVLGDMAQKLKFQGSNFTAGYIVKVGWHKWYIYIERNRDRDRNSD